MVDLFDRFVNAVGRSAPELTSDRAELEPLLHACLAGAKAAWPGLTVDPGSFVAHLQSKLPASTPLPAALRTVRAADLYLAFACAQRDPAALVAFEARFSPLLGRALAAIKIDDDDRAEVRQQLRVELFTPRDGRPPLTADYAGRSELGSWVRPA